MRDSHIVCAGVEGVIWVIIIIGSIIGQIVKASKKAKGNATPGRAEPLGGESDSFAGDSAESELQEFLGRISGTQQSTPPPQPPQPRRAPQSVITAPVPPPPPSVAFARPPSPPVARKAVTRKAPSAVSRKSQVGRRAVAGGKKAIGKAHGVAASKPGATRTQARSAVSGKPKMASPSLSVPNGRQLAVALSDRQTLREAIVLREIFGPPLALQQRDQEKI